MDQNKQNSPAEEKDEEPKENFSPQKDIDPRKLNISLVFIGILFILLMWYISAKLF